MTDYHTTLLIYLLAGLAGFIAAIVGWKLVGAMREPLLALVQFTTAIAFALVAFYFVVAMEPWIEVMNR